MGFYECRDCSRPPDECRCGERELRDRLESAEQEIADLRDVVRVMFTTIFDGPRASSETGREYLEYDNGTGRVYLSDTQAAAINKVMGGE